MPIVRYAALPLLFLVVTTSCRHEEPPLALAQEASEHLARQQWQAAEPLLKRYLLHYPYDAAAHFYLGHCYLMANPPWPTVAQGELELALAIFSRRDNRKSPISNYSADDFEVLCYVGIARAHLTYARHFEDATSHPEQAYFVEMARRALEKARAINPDAAEIVDVENQLRQIQQPPRHPRIEVPSTLAS